MQKVWDASRSLFRSIRAHSFPSNVLCLKKRTFEGNECALILLNKDREASQTFCIPSLLSLLGGASPAMDMTPEHSRPVLPDDFREELPPAGYRIIHSGS